jgi:hypothetical protein
MGGPRRPIEVREMKKPKWKVGQIVDFDFLGGKRRGVILELKKNPMHIERWIYKIRDVDGIIIPYVGVNGSEKFANLYTKEYLIKNNKEILDITNE